MGTLKLVHVDIVELLQSLDNSLSRVERLKQSFERLIGVTVWRHEAYESIVYVQDCGSFGWRAIKFYNDGVDYRLGGFQESESLALQEAINNL